MSMREWETAEATILEVRDGANNLYATVLRARVRPPKGDGAFETTFPCPDALSTPAVGDILNVYYDTRDHTVRINTDDPHVAVSSAERRRRAREEEIGLYKGKTAWSSPSDAQLRSPPGWPHASKPGGADDSLDMIARLAELHSQGDLTDAEFAAAKAKLLAQQ